MDANLLVSSMHLIHCLAAYDFDSSFTKSIDISNVLVTFVELQFRLQDFIVYMVQHSIDMFLFDSLSLINHFHKLKGLKHEYEYFWGV